MTSIQGLSASSAPMVHISIKQKAGHYLMRNSLWVLIAMVAVIAAALVWVWPYIQMEFAGSAHYTEQDKLEYAFYTPDLLEKKCPVFLPAMILYFANITRPGIARVCRKILWYKRNQRN